MPTLLEPGQPAPLFSAKDQNGQVVKLKDFRGKKVVLYFYPQDDTPVCTVQACNLRDNYTLLQTAGYQVVGVSPDDAASHQRFIQKFSLPFPLLADPEHTIINAYGVWGEKVLYGRHYLGLHRTTFVIDEKGIIQKIMKKPRSKTQAEDILKG